MILVAAPTCRAKDYALAAYLEAYGNFNTSERALFMVDNTPGTLRYLYDLREAGVPSLHVDPMPEFWDGMEMQWQLIIAYAHELGAEWIASIESDMVCPPETLNVLLAHSGGYKCIAHDYPHRDPSRGRCISLGCTLISTGWLWDTRHLWTPGFENYIFTSGANRELTGLLDIVHLDEGS